MQLQRQRCPSGTLPSLQLHGTASVAFPQPRCRLPLLRRIMLLPCRSSLASATYHLLLLTAVTRPVDLLGRRRRRRKPPARASCNASRRRVCGQHWTTRCSRPVCTQRTRLRLQRQLLQLLLRQKSWLQQASRASAGRCPHLPPLRPPLLLMSSRAASRRWRFPAQLQASQAAMFPMHGREQCLRPALAVGRTHGAAQSRRLPSSPLPSATWERPLHGRSRTELQAAPRRPLCRQRTGEAVSRRQARWLRRQRCPLPGPSHLPLLPLRQPQLLHLLLLPPLLPLLVGWFAPCRSPTPTSTGTTPQRWPPRCRS